MAPKADHPTRTQTKTECYIAAAVLTLLVYSCYRLHYYYYYQRYSGTHLCKLRDTPAARLILASLSLSHHDHSEGKTLYYTTMYLRTWYVHRSPQQHTQHIHRDDR